MDPQNPRPLFDFDLNELPPPDDGGTVDASTPPQDDGGKFDDASTTAPGREPSPEYDATADASQADCLSPSQQMLDLDAPLSPMYDDDEEEDYGELQLPSPDPLYETDETEVACSPEKMTSGGCSPVIYPQRWRPQHHRRRGRTSMPESTWPRRRTHLLAWTCKARSLRSTSPRADTAGEHGGRTARRRRRLQLSPCGHRRRRHRHRHRALMPTSQRGQTTRRRLLRTGRASSGGSPCHATTLPPTPSLSSTVATTTRTLPGLPAEGSAEARPPTRRATARGAGEAVVRLHRETSRRREGPRRTNRTMGAIRGARDIVATKSGRAIEVMIMGLVATQSQSFPCSRCVPIHTAPGRILTAAGSKFRRKKPRTAGIISTGSRLVYTSRQVSFNAPIRTCQQRTVHSMAPRRTQGTSEPCVMRTGRTSIGAGAIVASITKIHTASRHQDSLDVTLVIIGSPSPILRIAKIVTILVSLC